MNKSYKFFLPFLLFIVFSVALPSDKDTIDSTSWTKKMFSCNPSDEEVNLILNLLYFSWMRSEVTLKTQEIFTDYLEELLMIGHDISNRRMNPSREQKYPRAQKKLTALNKQFHEELNQYKKISETYAQCLNCIIEDQMLSEKIEKLILKLRSNTRDLIISKSVSKASFKGAFHMLKTLMKKGTKGLSKTRFLETGRGFVEEYFWELFPPLAVASFIEFDKSYNSISKKWGDVLLSGSRLSNVLWEIIEETRAELYHSYYQEFYSFAQEKEFELDPFFESFDEYGPLEKRHYTTRLHPPD